MVITIIFRTFLTKKGKNQNRMQTPDALKSSYSIRIRAEIQINNILL